MHGQKNIKLNNTQCFVSKLLPSSAVITIPAFVWVNGGKTTQVQSRISV